MIFHFIMSLCMLSGSPIDSTQIWEGCWFNPRVCVRFSDLMIVLVCPVQTMRRQRTEVVVELRKVRSVTLVQNELCKRSCNANTWCVPVE